MRMEDKRYHPIATAKTEHGTEKLFTTDALLTKHDALEVISIWANTYDYHLLSAAIEVYFGRDWTKKRTYKVF